MKYLHRLSSLLLSLTLVFLPIAPSQAAFVGNNQLIVSTTNGLERAELLQVLDRDDARQQLTALGISAEQAKQRISQMTDVEVAQLNQRLADLPAGGSSVLGVLLIIFLVFIITDVIGATDIFPFVHPVK